MQCGAPKWRRYLDTCVTGYRYFDARLACCTIEPPGFIMNKCMYFHDIYIISITAQQHVYIATIWANKQIHTRAHTHILTHTHTHAHARTHTTRNTFYPPHIDLLKHTQLKHCHTTNWPVRFHIIGMGKVSHAVNMLPSSVWARTKITDRRTARRTNRAIEVLIVSSC